MVNDFEYRPRIEYRKKEAVPREPVLPSGEEERPHLSPFASDALSELFSALADVDEAIAAAERALATVKIEIDPDEKPDVSEGIKTFCTLNQNPDGILYNNSVINLSIVKRACEEPDNPLSRPLLDEFFSRMGEEDGLAAGEVYEALKLIRKDLADSIRYTLDYIVPDAAGVKLELPSSPDARNAVTAEVKAAEEARLQEFAVLEAEFDRAAAEIAEIPDSEIDPAKRSRLVVLSDRIAAEDKRRRSFYDMAEEMREKATQASTIAGRAKFMILSGTYEAFGDSICCFVRLLLNRIDTSSLDALQADIDRMISNLKSMRLLLRLFYDGRMTEALGLKRAIDSMKMALLSQASRIISGVMQEAQSRLVYPVVSWLEEISDDDDSCLPFAQIGSAVMDACEYVASQYHEAVMDQIRLGLSAFANIDKLFASVESKDKVRRAMKVIDALIDFLGSLRGRLDIRENAKKLIEDFIRSHEFDTVFDPVAGTLGRLTELCR